MQINDLTLLVSVPIVVAIVNLFLPVILRKILNFLALIYLLVLNIQILQAGMGTVVLFGQTIMQVDALSAFISLFIQILSFIILIFALKGVDKSIEKAFLVLYPLTVGFCNGVVLSTNSISLLIFWGLTGITLYLFALLGNTSDTPNSAKKTMIIVGGSDVFLILGLILVWFMNPS